MLELEQIEGFYFPSENAFTEDKKSAIAFLKKHGYTNLKSSYNAEFHYWSIFEALEVAEFEII